MHYLVSYVGNLSEVFRRRRPESSCSRMGLFAGYTLSTCRSLREVKVMASRLCCTLARQVGQYNWDFAKARLDKLDQRVGRDGESLTVDKVRRLYDEGTCHLRKSATSNSVVEICSATGDRHWPFALVRRSSLNRNTARRRVAGPESTRGWCLWGRGAGLQGLIALGGPAVARG